MLNTSAGAEIDFTAASPVTQSGTWTVQPGNTANTTAWKVDGSAVTQPVSQTGTWTVQPGNTANTTAWKVDGSSVTQPVSGTVSAVGFTITPTANFNRPADTTAYASGDLVANSTTAGSVAALSWTVARANGGSGMVRRARLKTSSTSLTNATFRLHLYAADPAASSGISNGDNSAWLTKVASYLGAIDITVDKAFSDAAQGRGVPNEGTDINYVCGGSSQLIYGLLEARAAYTPTSAETFTVDLEILEN